MSICVFCTGHFVEVPALSPLTCVKTCTGCSAVLLWLGSCLSLLPCIAPVMLSRCRFVYLRAVHRRFCRGADLSICVQCTGAFVEVQICLSACSAPAILSMCLLCAFLRAWLLALDTSQCFCGSCLACSLHAWAIMQLVPLSCFFIRWAHGPVTLRHVGMRIPILGLVFAHRDVSAACLFIPSMSQVKQVLGDFILSCHRFLAPARLLCFRAPARLLCF